MLWCLSAGFNTGKSTSVWNIYCKCVAHGSMSDALPPDAQPAACCSETRLAGHVVPPFPSQLCLRHTGVRNLKVWRVENPHLTLQFDRRTASLLCLESWVNVGALPSYNKIQDVCNRGYYLPEDGSGLTFKTGHITLDHPPSGACYMLYRAC